MYSPRVYAPRAINLFSFRLFFRHYKRLDQGFKLSFQPSRELAEQTCDQIKHFKAHLGAPNVRELLVVGGMKVDDQKRALAAGVDIVVATPGRLEDLIQNGYLSLTQCRFFILDEADGLLKAGYESLINRLHGKIKV